MTEPKALGSTRVFLNEKRVSFGLALELLSTCEDIEFYQALDTAVRSGYVAAEGMPRIFSTLAGQESTVIHFDRAKQEGYFAAAQEVKRSLEALGYSVILDAVLRPSSSGPEINGDEYVRELRERLSRPQGEESE